MASTPSTSLRLELMATGDQSGTWGDTTNTNLGTLLEQAITGVLSVAQGDVANLTLTNTDYVSNQARNAVINLTGAMTANRNMVVPTANKVYLVKNSTTGGFVVTVKTSAGTGVEVAPNTARWVYCDGTNVVDGLPGFGYGYATTATAAGTTTLTYGSPRNQFFTGSTTQTVTLPVASTMTLGAQFLITNNSTGSVTVNSSGGNAVQVITAGTSALITNILTSGTSAASWSSTSYASLNTNTTLTISGSTAGFVAFAAVSTDAGAAAGPIISLTRDSASPIANDILGQVLFNGEDSAGNTQEYGSIQTVIISPTSTTEASAMDFYVFISGSRTRVFSVGPNNPNTPTGFIDGYATTATAAGTTTLTVVSAKKQFFTGSTTQTVRLPVTSTLVLGQQYDITNNSTGAVTINSSGSNAIAILPPGASATVVCILTSGTSAASWSLVAQTATALESATTIIDVGSSTAPSSGQVLTATSSTAATWQTPSGGQPIPSSSTFAVGTMLFAQQNSGGNLTDGSTTAGSNIKTAWTSGGTLAGGAAQTGTYTNRSGATVPTTQFGTFSRTA